MREIARTTRFARSYKRLPRYVKDDLDRKLQLLVEQSRHPLLHIHKLKGSLQECFAINLRDGYRALFIETNDAILLIDVGPHDRYDRWSL